MDKMRIEIDEMQAYNDKYALWSVLYVIINGQCFPSEHWTDATTSVLSMWIPDTNRLLSGATDCVTLFFMDGDYSIKLTQTSCKGITAQCIEPNGTIVIEREIDLKHFARQLLSAVGKLTKHYAQHRNTQQINEIIFQANKLRCALSQLPD